MIDVMNRMGWAGISKEAILLAVKNDSSIIWDLPEIDEEIFRAAIEVDPTCVFNEWGNLHRGFNPEVFPNLVAIVLESLSGIKINQDRSNKCQVMRQAVIADWRVLGLLPDANEQLQVLAVNRDFGALQYIKTLTPALQLLALGDVESEYRVLFECGNLSKEVASEAKRNLLHFCQNYSESNLAPEYAAKYLTLSADQEIRQFLRDESLSCLVCIDDFCVDDPSDVLKKFFIERHGIEFVLCEKSDCWTLNRDLRLWVARRMNRQQEDGHPDIIYLPDLTRDEIDAFLCVLLNIPYENGLSCEQQLINAMKMHHDDLSDLCWLCWALLRRGASAAVIQVLVTRLCGLPDQNFGSFQKANLSVAFMRLSEHSNVRGIEAAVDVIFRLFPEMAGLYAVGSAMEEDVKKVCEQLANALLQDEAAESRDTWIGFEDLFESLY